MKIVKFVIILAWLLGVAITFAYGLGVIGENIQDIQWGIKVGVSLAIPMLAISFFRPGWIF